MRSLLALSLVALPLLADTENSVRKSAPAQPNGRLVLTTEMGSINVRPGTGSSVEVEAYFRGDSSASRKEFDQMLQDFSLDVTQLGSEVRVGTRFRGVWERGRSTFFRLSNRWCHKGGCLEYGWLRQLEFRVNVPTQFNVSLTTSGGSIDVGDLKGEANVRTSGGSLRLGKIDGPVDGRTSGGSITLAGAKGRTLVHTSGGSIKIDGTTGDVDASTSGGSINIDGTTGRVNAHTSGGGIHVRSASGPVDASTSGGSIEVALAANKGYDLDASTSGGGVSSEFPGLTSSEKHPRRLSGSVNGGGTPVRLRTSGGSIRVKRS